MDPVRPDVRIRPYAAGDLPLLRSLLGDPDMTRYVHAFPSVENAASNALCRRLGFSFLGEAEVEYPKGRMMRARHWRLDLGLPEE